MVHEFVASPLIIIVAANASGGELVKCCKCSVDACRKLSTIV